MSTSEYRRLYDWINALLEDFDNDERAKGIVVRPFPRTYETDAVIGFEFGAKKWGYECWFESIADLADKKWRDMLFYIGDEELFFAGMTHGGQATELVDAVAKVYTLMQYCEAKVDKFIRNHPIEDLELGCPVRPEGLPEEDEEEESW